MAENRVRLKWAVPCGKSFIIIQKNQKIKDYRSMPYKSGVIIPTTNTPIHTNMESATVSQMCD